MTTSNTLDKIRALLPDLTEDDAFSVLYDIAAYHGWVALAWSMGDVAVRDEADDDEDDDWGGFGETDVPLTRAERDAVASTYEWRKGINEAASEHVSDVGLIPTVVRHRNPDGEPDGFTVKGMFDEQRYTADGTPVGE